MTSEDARRDPEPSGSNPQPPARTTTIAALGVRGLVGGCLMGFANVVPGISGGAMLIIVGIYTRFIDAMASVVRFRFSLPALTTLGSVGLAAAVTILLSAKWIADLVVNHPVEMYSIFTGLRLGAVPVVWRLARPLNRSAWIGVIVGLLVTGALATLQYRAGVTAGGETSPQLAFAAGLVGASATMLPGMDGSYFLLLMGQYLPILNAVGRFTDAAKAGDFAAAGTELWILLPTAAGVGLGLAGVSLLLKWLLTRYPKPTLGVLLGVVIGAFVGLYPFREAKAPAVGDVVRNELVTTENLERLSAPDQREHWPLVFYKPTLPQAGYSLLLVGVGLGAALLLSKLEPKGGTTGPSFAPSTTAADRTGTGT